MPSKERGDISLNNMLINIFIFILMFIDVFTMANVPTRHYYRLYFLERVILDMLPLSDLVGAWMLHQVLIQ